MRETVQERVQPLLDATAARIATVLDQLSQRKDQNKKKVAETYQTANDSAEKPTDEGRDNTEDMDTSNIAEKTGVSYAEVVKNGEDALTTDNAEEVADATEPSNVAEVTGVSYAEVVKTGEVDESHDA
jgi:coproporphyrinogen III oxidase